eukprot:NODE_8160_length_1518_cov_4.830338.p2 GENE.NODE_8160_length_1518_cov_4.830338~~NODE_8160_length_1518_cov_4.830338.p2  ORF type:complete len:198 (+),score=31.24 NODE_8160_length_1518_cov_4.830338:665-1258(+)
MQDISNMAWSCSLLEIHADGPLLDAISSAAIRKISDANQQNIGNTAWSIARLAVRDRPLRAALAASAIPTLRSFVAQGMSNTAWACATLAFGHAPLLYAIAAAAIPPLDSFDSQALGNTAWAFAQLPWRHREPLLNAIAAAARRNGAELHAQSRVALTDALGAAAARLLRGLGLAVADFVHAGLVWRPASGSCRNAV